MSPSEAEYLAYILRLWPVQEAGVSMWHASLQSVETGKVKNFASLADLVAYLQQIPIGSEETGEKQSLNRLKG